MQLVLRYLHCKNIFFLEIPWFIRYIPVRRMAEWVETVRRHPVESRSVGRVRRWNGLGRVVGLTTSRIIRCLCLIVPAMQFTVSRRHSLCPLAYLVVLQPAAEHARQCCRDRIVCGLSFSDEQTTEVHVEETRSQRSARNWLAYIAHSYSRFNTIIPAT